MLLILSIIVHVRQRYWFTALPFTLTTCRDWFSRVSKSIDKYVRRLSPDISELILSLFFRRDTARVNCNPILVSMFCPANNTGANREVFIGIKTWACGCSMILGEEKALYKRGSPFPSFPFSHDFPSPRKAAKNLLKGYATIYDNSAGERKQTI